MMKNFKNEILVFLTSTLFSIVSIPLCYTQDIKLSEFQFASTRYFEQNLGQVDSSVEFFYSNGISSFAIGSDRIVLSEKVKTGESNDLGVVAWEISPLGALPSEILGFKEVRSTKRIVDRSLSVHNIKFYEQVIRKNVYDGVDFKFYFMGKNLKYDIVIHPHSESESIKLEYCGVKSLGLDEAGNLLIQTPGGLYAESKPIAHQVIDGVKRNIPVSYVLRDNIVTYQLGSYDRNYKLIIDPIYLNFSTYLYGDSLATQSQRKFSVVDLITKDRKGNFILAGTTSEYFPIKQGLYDSTFNGDADVFLATLSAQGDSLLSFTYLGGSGYEYPSGLFLDSTGNIYLAGSTLSDDFPVSNIAFDTSYPAVSPPIYKGFVCKFDTSLSSLLFSTYWGGNVGSLGSGINAMAVDEKRGLITLVGWTGTSDFPVSSSALQRNLKTSSVTVSRADSIDGFISQLSIDSGYLVASSYLGGAKRDFIKDLLMLENGEIVVGGYTWSTDFYNQSRNLKYFNQSLNGRSDGFFLQVDSALSSLKFSNLVGGSGDDQIENIAKEGSFLYVVGETNSSDLSTSNRAMQKASNGLNEVFLMKVQMNGVNVDYSTYLGGSSDDQLGFGYGTNSSDVGLITNKKGEVYVIGSTASTDFPVTRDAVQQENYSALRSMNTEYNRHSAFVAKIGAKGDSLAYSTYWGGFLGDLVTATYSEWNGCQLEFIISGVTTSFDIPTSNNVYRSEAYRHTERDSIFDFSCRHCENGFISCFRDTISTDQISFSNILGIKDTLHQCNVVYQPIDIGNYGADIHWTRGLEGSEVILRDTGWFHVWATYGCDTVSDSVYVALNYSPKPDLGPDSIYCDQYTALTLHAQNERLKASYLWSDSSVLDSLVVHRPGKYWVNVRTEHCGSASDTIVLGLEQTPQVNNYDTAICDAVPITLDAGYDSSTMNYRWSTGDSTRSVNITDSATIQLKLWSTCGSDSATIKINSWTTPQALLPADTVFCDSVDLQLVAGKPDNGEEYLWLDRKASISLGTNDSLHLKNEANVELQILNSCGADRDSMIVSRVSSILHGRLDTLIECETVSEILLANGSEYDRYQWNDGSKADRLEIDQEGRYSVVVENACGIDSNVWWVVLKKTPKLELTDDTTFCDRVDLFLDASIDDNDATYSWQDGSTASSLQVTQAGTYSVTVSNACGKMSDQVRIDLLTTPMADLGEDTAYCGSVLTRILRAGNAFNQESYLWWDGSRGLSNTITRAGSFWVEIENRCGSDRDTVTYSLNPEPVVDLGPDTVICGDFPYLLDAGHAGSEYLWQPGGESTQIKQVNAYGTYAVKVTDSNGCTGLDDISIEEECNSTYYIPTAFSPNNDGVNDLFRPVVHDVTDYELIIYNRWGDFIFQTTDPLTGWDGIYKGDHVQNDIYYYLIKFKLKQTGEEIEESGRVHVLR